MIVDSKIPIRLAAALLLKRGEITLREIRSLPFVENDKDYALAIANNLAQNYEIEQFKRVLEQPIYQVDDVLRVVTSPVKFSRLKRSTYINSSATSQKLPEDLGRAINDRFSALGGVELDLPLR